MSEEAGRSEFAKRLRKIPARLALALVNATAVLVIATAVLAIVALNRVENAAARISTAMTDAVLSKVDIHPAQLKERLQVTDSAINDLRATLKADKAPKATPRQQQIAKLTEVLTGLRADVKKLTEAKTRLTDEAIREAGNSVINGLLRLRKCQPIQSQ